MYNEYHQRRDEILSNFKPVILSYLREIKDNNSNIWNLLLKIKNYNIYYTWKGFSSGPYSLRDITITFFGKNNPPNLYNPYIGITKGRIFISPENQQLYQSGSGAGRTALDWDSLEKEGYLIFSGETDIYLSKKQIDLITTDMFNYI
jgi:hypothetical protein